MAAARDVLPIGNELRLVDNQQEALDASGSRQRHPGDSRDRHTTCTTLVYAVSDGRRPVSVTAVAGTATVSVTGVMVPMNRPSRANVRM